jgi:HSP20 family protein
MENLLDTPRTGNLPAVNIHEDEKQFVLEFAVPGMNKEDFKINLEEQVLTVSSETKEEKEEQEDNFTRREFYYNGFSRSFTIPDNIDTNKIKADYKDGILKITLPKSKEARLSREIKIS